MKDLGEFMGKAVSEIEGHGYMIESKSSADGAATFNISYYDAKHIAKYSFVGTANDKDEIFIKITAAFLSGIEEDFTKIVDGKSGVINVSNAGKSKECKIEYKLKTDFDEYKNLDLGSLLQEVEDSIYRVKYRKYFAL